MKKILLIIIFFSMKSFASNKDSIVYSTNITGQYLSGNINSSSLGFGGELSGYNKLHYWSILPTYRYVINNLSPSNTSVSKQNEFYSTQSYNYKTNRILKMLIFSEVEHSQVRKIDIRANVGYGAGWRTHKYGDISLSEVILPDYYRSLQIKGSHIQRNNTSIRSSTRFKFMYKINSLTFTSIEMFQPSLYTIDFNGNISNVNNINFRSINQFDFLIKGGLSFGLSIDFINQTYINYLDRTYNLNISPSDLSINFYLKYKGKF